MFNVVCVVSMSSLCVSMA